MSSNQPSDHQLDIIKQILATQGTPQPSAAAAAQVLQHHQHAVPSQQISNHCPHPTAATLGLETTTSVGNVGAAGPQAKHSDLLSQLVAKLPMGNASDPLPATTVAEVLKILQQELVNPQSLCSHNGCENVSAMHLRHQPPAGMIGQTPAINLNMLSPELIAAVMAHNQSSSAHTSSGTSYQMGGSNTNPSLLASLAGSTSSSSSTNNILSSSLPAPVQPSSMPVSLPSIPHKQSSGSTGGKTAGGNVPRPKMNTASVAAMHHTEDGLLQSPSDEQMKSWSLEQLDAHVKHLNDTNQPVPNTVNLLVANVRRREKKRLAKRMANRKSAYASRARKKALFEKMASENATLKRQAAILSYLPDPVVAILTDGIITFCSMQVERVLKHQISGPNSLIGANIQDIMVPNSRESMRRLIEKTIINSGRMFFSSNNEVGSDMNQNSSDQFFPPLPEVDVGTQESIDVSDSSGKSPSSNNVGSNSTPSAKKPKTSSDTSYKKKPSTTTTESDESVSTENKANAKANANLTKNVEEYKLNKNKREGSDQAAFSLKDDVMGASVTANNADAKLSSLMHYPYNKDKEESPVSSATKSQLKEPSILRKHALRPKMSKRKLEEQSSSSAKSPTSRITKQNSFSEDSGYQESNESQRNTPSSSDPSSELEDTGTGSIQSSGRLAPVCNVCLIRSDLSTIWCELTASILAKPFDDASKELDTKLKHGGAQKGKSENNGTSSESDMTPESGQMDKELLLCFRPVRDGGHVGEQLRFIPRASASGKTDDSDDSPGSSDNRKVSSGSSKNTSAPSSSETHYAAIPQASSSSVQTSLPPKKRKFEWETKSSKKSRDGPK